MRRPSPPAWRLASATIAAALLTLGGAAPGRARPAPASRPTTSRPATSRPISRPTSRPATSRPATSRPATSRPAAPTSRPSAESGPTKPGCRETLDVRVVDDASGEALDGASLRLRPDAAYARRASGLYRASGLCRGPLRLEVRRAGYRQRVVDVRLPRSGELSVALSARRYRRLDDVIVQAPAPRAASTRSQIALRGDALERTRGRDLADSLASVSGVTTLRSGANAKPMVRGLFGRRLLLLFDRVRHESQKWGLDHAPEIDPFAAGTLTVVKGAAGVRYGPDAVGGAILVDPHPLRFAPGYAGELHLVGVSNGRRGTVALRLDGAHAALPGFAWRVEANLTRGAALSTPDYALDNTGILRFNVGATVGYERRQLSMKLSYRRHFTKNGVFSGVRNETVDDFLVQARSSTPKNVALFSSDYAIERAYQQVSHDLAIARLRLELGHAGTLGVTYAFQLDDRDEFDTVRQSVSGPQFDFSLQSHTLDARFEHARVTLGNGPWALRGTVGLFGMFQRNVYSGLPLIPSYRQLNIGVYAIERLSRGALAFEAGLRFDHISRRATLTRNSFNKKRSQGRLDADTCTPDGSSARCLTSFNALTSSLGASYRFASGLTAKLDASSAARAPVVDEQYIDGTAPSFPVLAVGDPRLGLETTWGLSATLAGAWRNVAFEASAFANLINNYIYFAPALDASGQPIFDVLVRGTFPRFSHRAIDALFYGVDGGVTVGARWPFEVRAQAAMVWAEDADSGGFLVFVPPFRARVALTYKPPDVWRLFKSFASVKVDMVARQTRFDQRADFVAPPTGYVLLGAALGTRISLGRDHIAVTLELNNLLDRRYRSYTSLLRYFADEPGRELMLRLSYHLKT